MIKITIKGDLKRTNTFFENALGLNSKLMPILEKYGVRGVEALRDNTPKDSGETANSWSYEVTNKGIIWTNSKILSNGVPLAILLQYGHGTKGGSYVQGIDYINPALKPIFDQIAEESWKEVQSL